VGGEVIPPPSRPVRELIEPHLNGKRFIFVVKPRNPHSARGLEEDYNFTSYPHLELHGSLKGKFILYSFDINYVVTLFHLYYDMNFN
jgi:hypothetical protein